MYSPKMNAHFKYMDDHPDEFNSSNDENSQPDDARKTVENSTAPSGNEENEENVARRDPCAMEPDSGDSMDQSTLNYSEDYDDKKSADNSLDDDRKPAAR